MSKSISGSGSLNLTVQELRFLEIKASLISAINATIDGLLTAVNANFTGLVTITDLTISGTVTVENITVLDTLTAEYIIANQGITGDLTGKVNVETTASTNQGALRLPMIDADTSGGTSSGGDGLLSSSHKLRFDESTGTLIVSDYISVPTLSVETQAYILPVTSNTDTEYKVAMFGNLNVLTGDSITYNCFQNRLTVPNLQVTGGLEITPATSNADIEYAVTFFGLNNALTGNSMTFNPLNNRLTVTDLQATDNVTIGDDLTVSGNTSIKALNNTTANFNNRIPFINGDSTDTGVLVSRGNFNYNTSSQTLNCGTFNGTLNGSVSNAVTIGTQDITASGTITICSKDKTATSELCRLLFLDGQSTIGTNYDIVRDDFLYYKPNDTLLVGNSIRGQVQMITPLLVLLGANNSNGRIDIYDDGTAVRNRYFHPNGHLFVDGNVINSNKLFMTNTTQTRVYNPLQCDGDVTVSGTLTASVLNIGTQTATNFSVVNDITVGGDTILSNVPTASGSTPLSIMLLGANKIQRGSITFNPLSNILSTTNIGLTGNLLSSLITTTGNGSIGGDLVVTGNGSIGGDLVVTDDTSIGGDLTVGKQFIGSNTTLPLGYTIIYHATSYDCDSSGTWGLDNNILLYTTSSSGASPTVYQYGKDVSWTAGTTTLKGAINFYSDVGTNSISYWGLMENKYAGLYRVRVSLIFQNDDNTRITPKIYIQKRIQVVTGIFAYVDEPQISTGIDYARHDVGEIVTLTCEGVVRLAATYNVLRIKTLLKRQPNTSPPTWPDTTVNWSASDINIDMQFLGEATNSTGEFIDAL